MDIIDAMNYRYNNPDTPLAVDRYIVEAFLKKERTEEQIDQMNLWASMSKEKIILEQMLINVQKKENDYSKTM